MKIEIDINFENIQKQFQKCISTKENKIVTATVVAFIFGVFQILSN